MCTHTHTLVHNICTYVSREWVIIRCYLREINNYCKKIRVVSQYGSYTKGRHYCKQHMIEIWKTYFVITQSSSSKLYPLICKTSICFQSSAHQHHRHHHHHHRHCRARVKKWKNNLFKTGICKSLNKVVQFYCRK